MHQFDQDIIIEPEGHFSFTGRITDNWSIFATSRQPTG